MGQITPAAVIACVLVASLSRLAEAQTITGSFDELSRFLRSGDLVQVTDGSGAVTWGRVTELSDASLILNEMEKAPDRAAALTTGRRRVFSENDITTIVRSDVSGRAGEPIYSTSWHRVQMLAAGTDVGIVLKNGERQSFRLSKAGSDVLHLSTTDGREETIAKSEIRRINRLRASDSTSNGLAIGALTVAGTMFAITATMYAKCDAGCDAPAEGPTFAMSMGFGAGVGAVAGWLIDKMHKGTEQVFPALPPRRTIGLMPIVTPRARGIHAAIVF
jgi:hypothetical protein